MLAAKFTTKFLLRASAARALPVIGAVRGHCQVPCGIFDDPARVEALKEDAATVRKAMVQINELAGAPSALSLNQATRWIMTKEEHAKNIITTARYVGHSPAAPPNIDKHTCASRKDSPRHASA